MALNRGGKLIPIEERVINRVSAKENSDFFNPGQPAQPAAPVQAKGRTFDYPSGYNIGFTPRAEQPSLGFISFQTLRQISDPAQGGLDIVAMIVESLKDQIAGLKWNIKGRDGTDGGDKARLVMAKLQTPDGHTPFRSWLRPVIHDHLIIDQPAIYIRRNAGQLPDLDVMDGATLKLLIDEYGRTPEPPYAAYQQVIKGIPAVDYSTQELLVPIYNRRSNKIYGYSRVEQAINIIGLGLRKQLSQTQYYTEGSIPDLLISTPESWNVDQVYQYQEYWDSILGGNTAMRRKARFIPSESKPFPLKETPLFDQLDEWIARVVSYCFSVSPDWAVAQMNRSTAEVAKETALQQGIAPIKLWLTDVMNTILANAYDSPELEFTWISDTAVDPKQQAEILAIYTNPMNPILTINEARKELGLDPLETTQDSIQSPLATPEPSKVSKKKKSLATVSINRKTLLNLEKKIKTSVKKYFREQKKIVLDYIDSVRVTRMKADDDYLNLDIAQLIALLGQYQGNERIISNLQNLLNQITSDTARLTLGQIIEAQNADVFRLVNEEALRYAQERSGTLITGIDSTTLEVLREQFAEAILEGLSAQELADLIDESGLFGDSRALLIARTESSFAHNQGSLIAARESGVVEGKSWLLASDACEICESIVSNHADPIPLDANFSDEDGEEYDAPPAHPNCRCTLTFETTTAEDIEE